jgi:pimeloyl-ACP methyl ester carboxylesterase
MSFFQRTFSESLLKEAEDDQCFVESNMQPLTLADGSTRRYLSRGVGEALVCIPMIPELNFVYVPQLRALSTHRRVILYEPQLSRSTRVGIKDRADETRGVLDALRIDRAHLVAWSDTGSPAYIFARDWRERCSSVTFLGLADRYRFPLPLAAIIGLYEALPIERFVPQAVVASILGQYLSGRTVRRSWVRAKAMTIPELPSLFKFSVLPNLLEHKPRAQELQVPCALICGDADALVSLSQARRMLGLLPLGSLFVEIPNGEHFLNYVSRDAVNESIERFLNGIGH